MNTFKQGVNDGMKHFQLVQCGKEPGGIAPDFSGLEPTYVNGFKKGWGIAKETAQPSYLKGA